MASPTDPGFWSSPLRNAMQRGRFSDPYRQHIVSYRAMQVIATNIAALRLVTWDGPPDEGGERIKVPALDSLLARPNPHMLRQDLILASIVQMLRSGETWWRMFDSAGRQLQTSTEEPRWIVPCSGDHVALRMPDNAQSTYAANMVGAWWQDKRTQETLLRESNLQIKFVDPDNIMRGLAPEDIGLIEIETDWSAAMYDNAFFKNSAVPDGALVTEAPLMPEQRNSIREQFLQKHRGIKNAHTLAVLSHGMKYERLGDSHREMEYEKGRRFGREQVSILFGVPESELGNTKDTKYLNGITGNEALWGGVFLPIMTNIEDTLNDPVWGLSQRYAQRGGIYIGFDRTRVKALMDRIGEKMEQAERLWRMGVPLGVINSRLDLGLPADLPSNEMTFFDAGVTSLQEVLNAGKDEEETGPDDEDDDTEEEAKEAGGTADSPVLYRGVWESRDAMIRTIVDEIDSTWDYHAGKFNSKISAYLREYRRAMLEKVDALGASGKSIENWAKGPNAEPYLLDEKTWKRRLSNLLKKNYKDAVVSAAKTVGRELGGLNVFQIGQPSISKFIDKLAIKVTRVEDTIREALRISIGQGLQNGEVIADLKDRVRGVMNVAQSRAKTIARTESGFAINGGRYQTMKLEKVPGTEWSSFIDDVTRDSHVSVNGEKRKLGEKFSNGLRYPMEPGAPAEEVINCRCVAITLEPEEFKS